MSDQLSRAIPATGERIPAVGLGTYNVFDVTAGTDRGRLKEVLQLFRESGGRVVDSSPMYGHAEEAVGDLAAELGARGSLFLATKVWTTGKEAGIRQMENSFRLLRTEVIDLMQVHNLVDWETHLKTMTRWKEQGRIRYAGLTHYSTTAFPALIQAVKNSRPDFIQIHYSISTRQAEDRLLPLAADLGIAVIANRPLETSALFGKVKGQALPEWARDIGCSSWSQFFLKFLLSHPAVTCVIPATADPAHLLDNMSAGTGPLPDKQMRKKMAEYVDNL
jgi:diketogulonate reductase-like aldo/keto reductase